MRRLAAVSFLVLFVAHTATAQIVFGGEAHVGLQNWSSAGSSGDSKLGLGVGGLLGVGFQVEKTMKLVIGPRMDFSAWSTDAGGSSTAYIDLSDIGAGMLAILGNFHLTVGSGVSAITAGVRSGGQDVHYTYSGDHVNFYEVGIGYRVFRSVVIGLSSTSYTGVGKDFGHADIRVGLSR